MSACARRPVRAARPERRWVAIAPCRTLPLRLMPCSFSATAARPSRVTGSSPSRSARYQNASVFRIAPHRPQDVRSRLGPVDYHHALRRHHDITQMNIARVQHLPVRPDRRSPLVAARWAPDHKRYRRLASVSAGARPLPSPGALRHG